MPDRKRFKTNEEYNQWFKEYRKRFPEKWREYRKKRTQIKGHDYIKYEKRYPEKYRAHKLLQYAVKKGYILRGVCKCGETKTQGHHEDYSKPLEVVWVCHQCHAKLHSNKPKDLSTAK